MKALRGIKEEFVFIFGQPDLVGTVGIIETAATLTRVGLDQASVQRPRQNELDCRPGKVGLSWRCFAYVVAPFEELIATARIYGEVAEVLLLSRPRVHAQAYCGLPPLREIS